MCFVAVLFVAFFNDVLAVDQKLNAGQRLGVRDASEHPPDFPELLATDEYAEVLDGQGKIVENQVVDSITEKDLMSTLKQVTTLGVKHGGASTVPSRSWADKEANDVTEQWLQTQFHSMGFDSSRICLQRFEYQGVELANVVAFVDVPGSPGSVTVGAHYDSRPFVGLAPGANDNGSGLAALLAMAKAFKGSFGNSLVPRKPVYFVAFAGEEPGVLGSKHFVAALRNANDGSLPTSCRSSGPPPSSVFLEKAKSDVHLPLHEALIMDEIGWRSSNLEEETVNLETYDSDIMKGVLDHLTHSNKDHNGEHGLKVIHSSKPFGSDHMSWLGASMPAVLSINGDDEAYPNYHKSSDSIESVNGDMLSKVTKMNAGALVRMAGVQSTGGAQMKPIAEHM